MKKGLENKLALRKETLRDLDAVRLAQVIGALPPPTTKTDWTCEI